MIDKGKVLVFAAVNMHSTIKYTSTYVPYRCWYDYGSQRVTIVKCLVTDVCHGVWNDD